ncbi:MAG: hypothetical protein WAL29_03505, partial [Bacteroidales bacterium]
SLAGARDDSSSCVVMGRSGDSRPAISLLIMVSARIAASSLTPDRQLSFRIPRQRDEESVRTRADDSTVFTR